MSEDRTKYEKAAKELVLFAKTMPIELRRKKRIEFIVYLIKAAQKLAFEVGPCLETRKDRAKVATECYDELTGSNKEALRIFSDEMFPGVSPAEVEKMYDGLKPFLEAVFEGRLFEAEELQEEVVEELRAREDG